jgi:formate--tetrahydrofolate ligase
LAKKVVSLCDKECKLHPIYDLSMNIEDKISNICKKCYGASGVEYSDIAKEQLKTLKDNHSYICMAKTPISLTDNEKVLIINEPFKIHVKELLIANGANFVIVITGNIFRMPGLPKIPEANKF